MKARKKKGRNVVLPWMEAHRLHGDRGCLEWPFAVSGNGYGWLRWKGKSMNASRVMCEMAHGSPPSPRYQALHSCDNKTCVNPNHLSWGTCSQNNADAYARNIHGNRTRLPASTFSEIRALIGTRPQADIARQFGVSASYVSKIHLNRKVGKTAQGAG